MKLVTLCFPVRDRLVYLATKKEGIGVGNINGFGGKAKDHETPEQAALRELAEEAGIFAEEQALEKVAEIEFYIGGRLMFICHVFFVSDWQGVFRESEEMGPAEPYPIDRVPYERMWKGDGAWLPLVFTGRKIRATVYYADNHDFLDFRWLPLE